MSFSILTTCIFSLSTINLNYYTYGSKFFLNPSIQTIGIQINSTRLTSGLSLSKTNTGKTFLNSVYSGFPLSYLGFIKIGFTRLNGGMNVKLPRDYVGLDFYNPQFSFGVFKRYDKTGYNQYTLRTSITRENKYQIFLLSKDYYTSPILNFCTGYSNKFTTLEAALSLSSHVSFAVYAKKAFRTDKTSFSLSIQKYFSHFFSGTRKTPAYMSISGNFGTQFFQYFTYTNNTTFTDRNGYKNIMSRNEVAFMHPNIVTIKLFDIYNITHIPGFSIRKSLPYFEFNFNLSGHSRSYSLHFRRKPLYIRLSRQIDRGEPSSRIYSQLDFGKFSQSFEYYYGYLRRYLVSNTSFRFKGLTVYQNFYHGTQNTETYTRWSMGVNLYSPLKVPSLSVIKGRVYYDKNGNNIFDDEDEPLDSIKIVLDRQEVTYTDDKGQFTFKFVSPGEHTVMVDLGLTPADLGSTTGNSVKIRLGFADKKNIQFKIAHLGSVQGKVYVDNNVNGVFDDHDQPLTNCIISLNGKRTWTWDDGSYRFENVPPGSYTIKVEYCPEKIIPVNKDHYEIYVMPGDKIKGLDFPFIVGEEIKVKVKKF